MNEYYTYIYYDPLRNNEPIYVGKGCKNRAWSHLTRKDEHEFTERLAILAYRNVKPIIGIYAGLTEDEAYSLEEKLVLEFGRKNTGTGPLLNIAPGGRFANRWTDSLPILTDEEILEIENYRDILAASRKPLKNYRQKIKSSVPKSKRKSSKSYSSSATKVSIREILARKAKRQESKLSSDFASNGVITY